VTPPTRGPVDATAVPRSAGPATVAPLPRAAGSGDVDVAAVGMPFDPGVSHRPGARSSPAHVQEAVTGVAAAHVGFELPSVLAPHADARAPSGSAATGPRPEQQ